MTEIADLDYSLVFMDYFAKEICSSLRSLVSEFYKTHVNTSRGPSKRMSLETKSGKTLSRVFPSKTSLSTIIQKESVYIDKMGQISFQTIFFKKKSKRLRTNSGLPTPQGLFERRVASALRRPPGSKRKARWRATPPVEKLKKQKKLQKLSNLSQKIRRTMHKCFETKWDEAFANHKICFASFGTVPVMFMKKVSS